MRDRRRVTYLMFTVAAVLVATAALGMPRRPAPAAPQAPAVDEPPAPMTAPEPPQPQTQPQPQIATAPAETPIVEVVFALDTTGSMSGLIDGAKRKIWSIVDFINSGQPQPKVRIGLVAYRDIGDEYVTRFFDLTDDMDTVFKHLSSFRADGGGDTPEHVARALSDAVERTSWSAGQNVAKIIYVVGDAPPHTDYDDGYDYKAISRKAQRKGIHVNTIRCGDDGDAKTAFVAMAKLGGGQFMSIAQSGGVATVDTPYDDKLAELNRRLTGTAVLYGRGHGAEGKDKVAAAMAAPATIAADRVSYAAKKGVAVFGEGDLLARKGISEHAGGGAAGAGAMLGALSSIDKAELPAEMAAMKPEQQAAYLQKKQSERAAVLEEIKGVVKEREAFLRSAEKRAPHKDAFDDSVRRSVAADSVAAGVKY